MLEEESQGTLASARGREAKEHLPVLEEPRRRRSQEYLPVLEGETGVIDMKVSTSVLEEYQRKLATRFRRPSKIYNR